MTTFRELLIASGVRGIKKNGYSECNKTNILTDPTYRALFAAMLRDNLGQSSELDLVINDLLKEIA